MDHFISINTPSPCVPATRWLAQFAHLAQIHPDRTAVICGSGNLSYAALQRRSDALAATLRTRGIGPGDFVGVGLQRSLELPIALLGILKSGAAYVPLDPAYPAARIAQMIASAKLETVISDRAFEGVETISPDCGEISPETLELPDPDDRMYAIFTSGSTGTPKAAAVYHRGFENLLHWYVTELELDAADRTLVISSPSFDLTQKNFYAPLAMGGTLILDDGQTYDISRITALIRDHGVTLLNCTPSAFYPLVEAAASDGYAALASLRFAVLGGEPISVPRLRAWLEHPACGAEVVNSYGPTECTDICAFHRLYRGNLDEFPFVPLGREIPNVEVSIRDESLALLPVGETGELCISGAGNGAGYLHDPERTAAAFVGGFYRTGDLAKRLSGGLLEFRGRADHQVKINGHRIELGEIEIALERHDGVHEAIVTGADNQLIAHLRGTASVAELREHLAELLPSYMVPGEFRFLESFPQTPNGKVDRLALAQTAPRPIVEISTGGSLESQILGLWSEILARPVHDATANFFDLGGDSIHLAVVHVRLMEMTGKKFEITELFALPSARAIATFLTPQTAPTTAAASQSRARQAQAAFSRFRPTPSR